MWTFLPQDDNDYLYSGVSFHVDLSPTRWQWLPLFWSVLLCRPFSHTMTMITFILECPFMWTFLPHDDKEYLYSGVSFSPQNDSDYFYSGVSFYVDLSPTQWQWLPLFWSVLSCGPFSYTMTMITFFLECPFSHRMTMITFSLECPFIWTFLPPNDNDYLYSRVSFYVDLSPTR